MADTCLADIDTHIDASPADITAAADWLGKLKKGFDEARSSLVNTMLARSKFSGEFGRALNEYVNDLGNGCWSASSELKTSIDVINSWHDQVVWRKRDMAGHRDDAKAGGLTVTSDRYIQPPEEVDNPGELPKGATGKQKSTWQTAHDNYTAYVEKKNLWDNLKSDVDDTRTQLTDWVAEHMTVNSESPRYEIILAELINADITTSGILAENAYYTEAYYMVRGKAIEDAAKRHFNASKSRSKYAKKWEPDRKAVAKRTKASMPARVNNANLVGKAKSIGKNLGIGLTLAIAGWDIYNGKSPSQTGIATTAGLVAGSGITFAAAAISAPGWVTVGAVAAGGTLIAWGVGEAYENWVPLRTRERIDEGIWDTWSVTSKTTLWGQVFG